MVCDSNMSMDLLSARLPGNSWKPQPLCVYVDRMVVGMIKAGFLRNDCPKEVCGRKPDRVPQAPLEGKWRPKSKEVGCWAAGGGLWASFHAAGPKPTVKEAA